MVKPVAEMESLLKALGDATRLRILGLLAAGEVCVCHIHESLRISQPKASRHLAYLRRSGLVRTRKEGLWVYYRLAEPSDPVLATIQQAVRHALHHLDVIKTDLDRLEKKTGCCVPDAAREAPTFACCRGG
jgi:ArsR family transcriptional regulator